MLSFKGILRRIRKANQGEMFMYFGDTCYLRGANLIRQYWDRDQEELYMTVLLKDLVVQRPKLAASLLPQYSPEEVFEILDDYFD